MERYEISDKIGEGTGGIVFLASIVTPSKAAAEYGLQVGDRVALKRVSEDPRNPGTGMRVDALREIKLLQELRHKNVVPLLDVYKRDQAVELVFPFAPRDLKQVIDDKARIHLGPEHIKAYMKMILEGVGFLHKNWVLHRDIKPDNVLVAEDGRLMVTDFGLSKSFGSGGEWIVQHEGGTTRSPPRQSNNIITEGYVPPELLLGAQSYGPEVDIWGVGCVFAELMLRRPFMGGPFQRGGHTDQRVSEDSREQLRYRHGQVDMLNVIANTIGLPPGLPGLPAPTAAMQASAAASSGGEDSKWPGYPLQPVVADGAQHPPPSSLDKTFGSFGREAVGLITRLLDLNAATRATASEGLLHMYFVCAPKGVVPELPPP